MLKNYPRILMMTMALLPGICSAGPVFSSDKADFRLDVVADRLSHPWSLSFLPNGDALVTERGGWLRIIRDGQLDPQPVAGVPELHASGQGGLLDVALAPNFDTNPTVILSYTHQNSEGVTTRVARATWNGSELVDTEVIFEALPRAETWHHFGGRLVFDREGILTVTIGDRGSRNRAQDTNDDAGGVHRLTIDGEPAPGNPFLHRDKGRATLYSVGHRNPQGLTIHPGTGEIWSHEHGPKGGDEINILSAGANYGWPEVTYGVEYSGEPISEDTEKEGMEQPLHQWTPSIAPSGMTFYTGDQFPQWQGDLFVGALVYRNLYRLEIQNGTVVEEERLLDGLNERIRDVRMGPDGVLWILTDESNGKVYRLVPVSKRAVTNG